MMRRARLRLPAAVVLLCVLFSGCEDSRFFPRMTEISDFEVAQVFGIDKKDDEIEITIVADRSSPGDEASSGGKITEIVSFTGGTVVDAISQMDIHSDKRQHLGYVDFLLIGEEAARDGLVKYLDFFTRDYEARYSTKVFVIRGSSAKDFLLNTASEERSIDDSLSNISELVHGLSVSQFLRIIDLVDSLGMPHRATIIPALEIDEINFGKMVGAEMPKMTFIPAGFAFIKDFKLVDYIDKELAPTYNFLVDEARTTPISFKNSHGDYVALDVHCKKVSLSAQWEGETLKSVRYSIMLYCTLNEQHGNNNIFTDAALAEISNTISEGATERFDAIIRQSQRLGQDGIELGERLRMAYPFRWSRYGLADKWDEVFSSLDITVEVNTQIRRTYDLREPLGYFRDELIAETPSRIDAPVTDSNDYDTARSDTEGKV